MRRSIDDAPVVLDHLLDDDITSMSWAVAISDDYDDAECRVVLTLEPLGAPGAGLVAHLDPDHARRLRGALHDALRELGDSPGR